MFLRFIQVPQIFPSDAKEKLGLREGSIVANGKFILGDGFFNSADLVQCLAVIKLCLGIVRQNLSHLCGPLDGRDNAAGQLRGTENSERNYECCPTKTMPKPGGPKPWRRQSCRSRPINPQHGSGLRFADLPNETVVIEMQQG